MTQPPLWTGQSWGDDHELDQVTYELERLDSQDGQRVARVLRYTLDQLLDGRRTGRWDYQQLHKTEKTHMGTLVEINIHREFDFADGDATDYRIAGIEVDCKFSQRIGGWEIGPEIVGHLCLVLWANDEKNQWRAGLVRARPEWLRLSSNRDAKRKLTTEGVDAIRWLFPLGGVLETNILLHLPPVRRDRIMNPLASGQARLLELCRLVQGRRLTRTLIETVGWGLDDPLKRLRGNGGARDMLRPEGILVLGHQDNDPRVARALGVPVPRKGEFVSVRVVPSKLGMRTGTDIDGHYWRVALRSDPIVAAPIVPRR